MNRDERQEENIEKWKSAGCKGTLEACTGYGKTYTAMKAVNRLQDSFSGATALVVVPTNYLEEQWNERISSFGLSGVKVRTIQGMNREYDGDILEFCTLLIPDEIHKYTADQFGQLYDMVDYQAVLGLTATIPENDEKREVIDQHAPVFDTVSLHEALTHDWVSPFIIYQLGIELGKEERKRYDEITDKFYKNFSWFNHDFGLLKRCSGSDKHLKAHMRNIGEHVNGSNIGRFKGHISRVWGAIRDRKTLLYGLDSKLEVVKNLLNTYPDKLTICFSQRTDFADRIHQQFPDRSVVYHSNIDGKEIDGEYYGVERRKERAIELFNRNDSPVNVLSTAQALDMGADIPDIDLAVITSATSKKLQSIQRIGRAIRYQEDKRAIIVDVYAKDTQDEYWLKNRYDSFPSRTIRKIRSIEDIDDHV